MSGVPLGQVVKLTPWKAAANNGNGGPFGTSVTVRVQAGGRLQLMKTAGDDFYQSTPEPERFFLPEDQLFVLVPAEDGFRILKYMTDTCFEAGDWFSTAGKRVRFLSLAPLDEASPSQIFFAGKGEGFGELDAWKLFCLIEGERFEIVATANPAKEWIDLALLPPRGPARDLFAAQPQPGSFSPELRGPSPAMTVKITNRTRSEASFELRWTGGSLPPLLLGAFASGAMTLDGVSPPHGTRYHVVARSGERSFTSDEFTSGPATYNPHSELILTDFFSSSRSTWDIGWEAGINVPR